MIRVTKLIVVLFIVTTSCYSVFAEELNIESNWYGKLGLGYVNQDEDYNEINFGQTEWDFESGFNISLSTGYAARYWALEGELSYRQMDIDHRTFKRSGLRTNYTGDQSQTALMLNSYLFPVPEWIISPYIGAGLGGTRISWNDIKTSGSSSNIDDSDIVFTYQLIIGASYKITPKIILEADYRYYAPDDAEIESSGGSVGELDNQELNIVSFFMKYKI